MTKINWTMDQMWRGCVLGGIAHAIAVSYSPMISNEQSWDGINYNVQDSAGQRGTVTFGKSYCVAAFRNENSIRVNKFLEAETYFRNAPKEVLQMAYDETLQYLLEEVQDTVQPVITAAFWGKDVIYTNDTYEILIENGANLLNYQLMDEQIALDVWRKEYGMTDKQKKLMEDIYAKKISYLGKWEFSKNILLMFYFHLLKE